ncbi:hypothetical protein GALMADRAFT_252569 [Galerina marginata CBS 339.88]|uniref:Stress-activated map kinase-interacting protein 1 n=1 Tax=Galerina marginata (strain CBS 339.88) TaxID=685588 RepID=A0A067SR56_GALM3|nr:hypothetical protein GALMADRAFT_252569 [Galerina marginata CBS 339.88]
MSLISDTDFLIHSLRLSYLRDVEDPYGPRIISLDPAYQSNPYILAASLADVDRWPQLALPTSPNLSEDEQERPLGLPGARLKHTQTIMGGRSGGLGMRVHGKRASTSKRMSGTPRQQDMKNFVSDNAPVQEALSTTVPIAKTLAQSAPGGSWIKIEDSDPDGSPEPSVEIQQATAPEEVAPVAKIPQFIPKFKGAAEMEARRRVRMAARRGPGAAAQLAPPPNLDFSSSSEDEVEIPVISELSSDEFEDVGAKAVDSMDEGDEFDPVFAATRATSDSASDGTSMFSPGSTSMAGSSMQASSSQTNTRSRPRLSPVSEQPGRYPRQKRPDGIAATSRTRGDSTSNASSHTSSPSAQPPAFDNMFARKKVAPLKPLKSSLSAMLASSGSSSNPFAEMYAAISGRGESASTNVQVFFPTAKQPLGKVMDLNVRRDATVEEVIGFALWSYWEEGWLPKLDEGLNGEEDPKWATKLSAVGWILRIAEDDGEVDDDFPPPDRMGKVAKFNADAYAILEATPTQIQQNQTLESKIQRRPSRTSAPKKPEKLNLPNAPPVAPGSAGYGSALGSMLSTSLGPSSSHGPQIFLRIRVADTADAVHISTTIDVSAGMYMQEALELVCRKRKLQNPNDYALLLADKSILIPLDRTVASLQGKTELLLVKRSMLPQMDSVILKGVGKTTDPNASIFKPMSDAPEQQYSSASDYTAAYKKYTIYRKMPMLVTRQERTLAIDGVYIHIMPSTNKARAVFDSGKTSSYHIKSIADCQQSAKTSSIFKIILNRGAGNKRYDFEAESPKLAAEIVQTIKNLKAALERTGTVNKSRRSRQVV